LELDDVSIELPEASILSKQMNKELVGKKIDSWHLQDYEKLHKIGFLNKNIEDFDQLVKGKIKSVKSRGNGILITLHNNIHLLLAPEYGGRIFYHVSEETIPKKIHLTVRFKDNTVLTVRLTGMGEIFIGNDKELESRYVYKRDFLGNLSPMDEDFTFKRFSELILEMKKNIKTVLVGKDAVLVGLSNSAFQDIIYRAKIHPKTKASELDIDEKKALFEAINTVVHERLRLGGKYQFLDLFGDSGNYIPLMGPNMKGQKCTECGTIIEKLSVGGGQVYYCRKCQVSK
jgi:formamidopyrimidine-DNA glycosylase